MRSGWINRWKHRYRGRWLRSISPNLDLNDQQMREVADAAFAKVWYSKWYPWYLAVVLGLALAVSMAVTAVIAHVIESSAARPEIEALIGALVPLAGYVFVVPVAVIIDLLLIIGLRPFVQRAIRRAMRSRGIEVCVPCGYLLCGLSEDVKNCPECGAAREPMNAPTRSGSNET